MLNWVKSLSRSQKRVIIIGIDLALIPIALLTALNLQVSSAWAWDLFAAFLPAMPYLLVTAAALSLWTGVSSVHLKHYEGSAIGMTAILAGGLALCLMLLAQVAQVAFPLAIYVVFGASYFVFVVISRAVLLQVLLAIYRGGDTRCRVLIYGAGTTGMQLVSAFRTHEHIEPVAFVDDSPALQGLNIARLPVYSPVRIAEIVEERNIDRVLLAMPSQSLPKQAQIARRLQNMGLEVQTLPSFAQLIGEEALVDKLQPLNPRSFLNRDEVAGEIGDDGNLAYDGRSVLISGAGGSIGSELCRQVMECNPERLVLFELCELALYNIHQELTNLAEGTSVDIVPVLGSVTDARLVRKVLSEHGVQVVLHAAAYKHVPMVELNPLAGLANNVLGTHTLAHEAVQARIERFILVSSDKAVRPTNVMGASKRLAELVVQDQASRIPEGEGPRFSIVRFGNVLGSSGSVVPMFQDQVRRGGPVTVTHPDVARFFMTVQEAVNLVLRAGAMTEGGEIYVLDMGKPVPIIQLARQVIESAGYTVRDAEHPDGDIEIEFTRLRPGEKMIEELTLSNTLIGTNHKKIFYTHDSALSEIEVAAALRALRQALATGDEMSAKRVAQRYVEGYGPRDVTQNPLTGRADPVT